MSVYTVIFCTWGLILLLVLAHVITGISNIHHEAKKISQGKGDSPTHIRSLSMNALLVVICTGACCVIVLFMASEIFSSPSPTIFQSYQIESHGNKIYTNKFLYLFTVTIIKISLALFFPLFIWNILIDKRFTNALRKRFKGQG